MRRAVPFRSLLACVSFVLAAACVATPDAPSPSDPVVVPESTGEAEPPASAPDRVGLTDDLRDFLEARGDGDLIDDTSFGGALPDDGPAPHDPIVLVHGNGDRGVGGPLGGWSAVIDGYLAAGRDPGTIFAVSWGPGDPLQAASQAHTRDHVRRVRRFLDAVLTYTGADRIDVAAHSMGVTLARTAIAGGQARDTDGTYTIGPPLTDRVDTFVGLAGANLGLSSCWATGGLVPTCGRTDGFWPGTAYGLGPVVGRSAVLDALAARPGSEGARRYVAWSRQDEILGPGALVWGEVTARLPRQDGERVLDDASHLDTRDLTVADQLRWFDGP